MVQYGCSRVLVKLGDGQCGNSEHPASGKGVAVCLRVLALDICPGRPFLTKSQATYNTSSTQANCFRLCAGSYLLRHAQHQVFAAGDSEQLRQVMDSYSSQAQRLQVSLPRGPAASSHAVMALMRLAAQPCPTSCLPGLGKYHTHDIKHLPCFCRP